MRAPIAGSQLVLRAGALVLALAGPAQSLDPGMAITQYTLTVWQTEDGLPQDSLTAIAQGIDGGLWLGTPSGIVRFDGTQFERVPPPEDWTPGERYITGMLADPVGDLWVTTTQDMLFRLRDGLFQRYGAAEGLAPGGGNGLVDAGDGAIWIATNGGLVRFADERGRMVDLVRESSPGANVLAVARGAGGRIWGATETGLLLVKKGTEHRYTTRDGLPSNLVNAVLEDRAGRVWIGTSLGLASLENGRVVVAAWARELKGRWIRCLLEDRDGNLWVGTRGNGAFRLRGDHLEHLSVADGLPNDIVRQILEDRDGALWFVTGGGLARLMEGPVTSWTAREGLPAPFIWSVHEEPGGDLILGTSGGGLVRLGPTGAVSSRFAHPDLTGVEIRSLLSDRHRGLWVGTGGRGLVRVREGNARRILSLDPLTDSWVYSLLEDSRGRIWVGTGDGIASLDSDGKVVDAYRHINGAPISAVRSIAEDAAGTIWFGTGEGLLVRVEDDRLTPVPGTGALVGLRIFCILPEPTGVVWLATNGGLVRIAGRQLRRMTTGDGLPNERAYWLIDDRVGHLYISTDVGILRLPKEQVDELIAGDRSRLDPLLLGRSDGMHATECNAGHPGGVRRQDGSLCFATTGGLACVDPARLRSFDEAPPVAAGDVLADGAPIAIERTPTGSRITVPGGARRLEIRYAAVALTAPEKLSFRYRLDGFDPDWVDSGTHRTAYYMNLPPGRYQFLVRAQRRGCAGSGRSVPMEVIMEPNLYQTGIFRAGLGAALVAMAAAIYLLRVRQIKGRYEAVLAERHRIARDIHDGLAQGLNAISLNLGHAIALAQHNLAAALSSVTRARTVAELSLEEARQVVWDLRQFPPEVDEWIDSLRSSTRHLAADSEPMIHFGCSGGIRRISQRAQQALTRICVEAVTNAIRHAHCKNIYVHISLGPETVELTVRDDGVGISERALEGAIELPHYGVLGMRERAAELHGELSIQTAPEGGTIVKARVPPLA